ncbi:MAG: AbrB/MazE/SpoVT family DNA-binding domain-containing protein [Alphaproteobacteria bacterium]|nr:AbrB/MazE/SpoVT family DNA-binding domain-containing protein [Alphaproteobacteria bacterium]
METTSLSSKGQVVLPKAIRNAGNYASGARFSVEVTSEGVLLRPLVLLPPSKLSDVAGCLSCSGKARTVEEMDAAVTEELKARRDRRRY